MEELWERAVEGALEGQPTAAPRTLTLDGAVKCLHGRLPPPSLLERFQSLEHLSIANVGVSSLEKFPKLPNLQCLILSDNRIAGGLEHLVDAGLGSLRDLDLSNNRIQLVDDLAPLAQLRLVSLDLYECPVTRIERYRSRVFGMIRSLKYLDKMDAYEKERPESDDEEEEDEEDDDNDQSAVEMDGGERRARMVRNGSVRVVMADDDIIDADDDDEESDEDEEKDAGIGTARINRGAIRATGSSLSNGFCVSATVVTELDADDEVDSEDGDADADDLGEEVDKGDDDGDDGDDDDDDDDDDDVVEVQEINDSDDEEEDIVEEDYEDEDYVDDDVGCREIAGGVVGLEGEIDGHEQGEEDGDEDENEEIGQEDEQGVEKDYEEDDDVEDEDDENKYLVHPIARAEEDKTEYDDHQINDDENGGGCVNGGFVRQQALSSSSQGSKRKRDDAGGSVKDSTPSRRS